MPPRKNKSARSTTGQSGQGDERVFHSRKERLFEGEQIRERVPHASHAVWKPPRKHRDPIELLEISNRYRLPNLVPVRYGRMLRSPFTFLRGSAGLMAHDLATTPTTGIQVQACGDCHLMNFGLFATPERNLIFDINDFDETLPAPWEWDVKRLAISFAVAARDNRLSDKDARAIAVESVRAYRERLRKFSKMSPLDVWYDRLTPKRSSTWHPMLKSRNSASKWSPRPDAGRRLPLSQDQQRSRRTQAPDRPTANTVSRV
jgi:hypothetical protein